MTTMAHLLRPVDDACPGDLGGPFMRHADAAPAGVTRAFVVAMEPDLTRAAQARRITSAHLRLWGLPSAVRDNALLIVSELVTNAVVHGRGDVCLQVKGSHDRLFVEVVDESTTSARRRVAALEDDGGRGLFLVDALSEVWGVSEDGRTTWSVIDASAGRA
ncbi:ATP-binding protein [Streptomyces sp. NPDC004732]|uniref:ATP-binding protein n=1 Tax=Streptomyces sp. NPDC004732 TaxID=3154290 RepID=UPI0033A64D2F